MNRAPPTTRSRHSSTASNNTPLIQSADTEAYERVRQRLRNEYISKEAAKETQLAAERHERALDFLAELNAELRDVDRRARDAAHRDVLMFVTKTLEDRRADELLFENKARQEALRKAASIQKPPPLHRVVNPSMLADMAKPRLVVALAAAKEQSRLELEARMSVLRQEYSNKRAKYERSERKRVEAMEQVELAAIDNLFLADPKQPAVFSTAGIGERSHGPTFTSVTRWLRDGHETLARRTRDVERAKREWQQARHSREPHPKGEGAHSPHRATPKDVAASAAMLTNIVDSIATLKDKVDRCLQWAEHRPASTVRKSSNAQHGEARLAAQGAGHLDIGRENHKRSLHEAANSRPELRPVDTWAVRLERLRRKPSPPLSEALASIR